MFLSALLHIVLVHFSEDDGIMIDLVHFFEENGMGGEIGQIDVV